MTLRISGISSGMDTESIITSLVESKEVPITTLEEKVEGNDELFGIWSELDTAVSILKSTASQLTSYTNWNSKSLSSTYGSIADGTVSGYFAETGTYSVSVSQLAVAHRYASDPQADTTSELGWAGVFEVNGQQITVEATDSLEGIMGKINAVSADMTGAGAKASIIGTTLTIQSNESGTGNEVSMSYVSGDDVLTNLNMFANERAALDLEATIDGISVTSKSNTGISSFINGVNLNFYDTGTTTISIERDTESMKSMINDFITSYNELMSYMKEETEVVSAGSDDNGILQGDSLANQMQRKSRSILTQSIDNPNLMDQDFNSLYMVGIWTENEDNQISIVDEERLDDALANNYEEVEALFRSYGTDGEGEGIFRQLEEYLDSLVDVTDGSITLRVNTIQEENSELQDKIDQMRLDLVDYEVDLWNHFAEMESAVSTIKSQGDYVFSSLGIENADS